MNDRCTKRVYAGTFRGHPCARKAKVIRAGLGYCTQHDPARIQKQRAERDAEMRAKWKEEEAAHERAREAVARLGIGSAFMGRIILSVEEVETLIQKQGGITNG